MSRRRRNTIAESFITHTKEMRESPAWRAIPDVAKRVLERLELEHMRHGGCENGQLIVTYDDFAAAGVRRQSVALALRQLVQLGFVEITQEGYRAPNGLRVPSKYRLTHVYGANKKFDGLPTHEWRRIKTDDEAELALIKAKDVGTLGSQRAGRAKLRSRPRLAA